MGGKHMIIGRSVKLNALGLQRINDAAAENGKALLSATALDIVPFGSEVEGLTEEQEEAAASVAPASTGTVGATAATDPIVPLALPAAVDNSLLDAFPPIGNQGGLNSCVPFSVTYYTLTHMVSRANGINAKTGGTAAALSPKFVYNLFNGGSDGGGSVFTAMQVIMNHGAPHWANWPYDSNVTAWPLSASIWREAIFSRARSMGWIADVNTPAGLENLKTMLVNGYVLNFETWIYDWEQRSISDDPATTADDAFVGQKICRQVTSTAGPHAMTVVGYNDDLWLDINGNGFVDSGEKGALKIANSWGTGYWNSGFYWVAYDAIQLPTKVQGWTQSATRQPVFRSNPYWMSVQPGYTPSHLAEITVSHRYRDQLKLVLGISGLDTTNPRKGWWPNLVYNTGSVCRITLTDDDPALEVTPTNGLSVAEGGTNTLSVRLTRVPPAGPVTVTTAMQAGSDPDLVVTAGSNLTFTTGTWSNWQMVVVSALEDGDQDSGTGRVEVALAGAPTVSVPAMEFDNDIQIMTTTNAVMMGTDTNRIIGLKLAAAPSQAVTVTVARVSGSTNIIVGSGTPAVFVATNWNAWRGVNISASLAGRAMNVEATLRGSSARALSTDVQVSAPLVTAAYGTPYWWLSAQAGATNFATDELLDTDHDGAAAWQEYRAGTAPSNAASVFRILRMDVSGTVSRIWWYGTTNSGVTTPFIIECGPQLGATNGWTNISPDLGRSGTGTNEWQHSPSPTSGPAFYRVKIKE